LAGLETRDTADLEVRATTRSIRKGAAEAMRVYVDKLGGQFPAAVAQTVDEVSRSGGTPLVVTEGRDVLDAGQREVKAGRRVVIG
jgi:K+-transporting ATPase ATPase B chain